MNQIVIKPILNCNFNCLTCYERRSLYSEILSSPYSKYMTISDWEKCLSPTFEKSPTSKRSVSGGMNRLELKSNT